MKPMMAFFITILMTLLAAQTFGQGAANRVQPHPVTNRLPKVIKFEGKGLKPELTTVAVTKPRPSAPPQPLSPAVLLSLYKSLGVGGAPQTNDYLLLTAQHPYVAGKGNLFAECESINPDQNIISFDAQHSTLGVMIKPAAVGQTYLIDITISVLSHSFLPNLFHILTPDQKDNTVGFSDGGDEHVLLTFVSTNTDEQTILLHDKGGDWYFKSCKVTLLK